MKINNYINNLTFIIIAIIINCVMSSEGLTTKYYVRAEATGNNDGSDWTNAWTTLPAALTRGDTFYVADGQYDQYLFDDLESGTDYIYIFKATESSHGTGTGWNSSYGDNQAVFINKDSTVATTITFKTGYYVFDGVTGAESDTTSYGFKILGVKFYVLDLYQLVGIPGLNLKTQVDHITFSHVTMFCPGKDYMRDEFPDGIRQQSIVGSTYEGYETHDITVSHNYMGNGSTNFSIRNWTNSTIEYNYFSGNWADVAVHGEQISAGYSDDIILRNNIFTDSIVAVVFNHGACDSTYASYRWNVYNNIVIGGQAGLRGFATTASGPGCPDSWMGCKFHHNTYINIQFGSGVIGNGYFNYLDGGRESYSYNNLFYNCDGLTWNPLGKMPEALIYDYDILYNCTFYPGWEDSIGAHTIITTGDPFKNLAAGDYSLHEINGAAAIDAGKSDLGSPFDIDYNGNKRTGKWDIGAFEFQSEEPAPTKFSLPQNYPNPFRKQTTISYVIPDTDSEGNAKIAQKLYRANLVIFNILGQRVKELVNEFQPPDEYTKIWDGRDDNGEKVSSGLYLYQLTYDKYKTSNLMLFMK